MTLKLTEHATKAALYDSAAMCLAQSCREGLDSRSQAVLALAGGSTPIPIYQRLGQVSLDWSRVALIPTDERWVPADHADANLNFMRSALAVDEADWRPLVPARPARLPTSDAALASLEDIDSPFDAVLLGMGEDGHFASLFPGCQELGWALDRDSKQAVAIVTPNPLPSTAPHPRVSLTLSRLLNARRVILVVTGQKKLKVLQRAASGKLDPHRLPVARLLEQREPQLEIHWSP